MLVLSLIASLMQMSSFARAIALVGDVAQMRQKYFSCPTCTVTE